MSATARRSSTLSRSACRVPVPGLLILALAAGPLAAQPAEPSPGESQAATATRSEEQSRIERLEDELAAIRAEVARMKAEMAAKDAERAAREEAAGADADGGAADRFVEIERRIEILAQEIERDRAGESLFRKPEKSEHGLGISASKVYQTEQGLSIGGYGEMLYQGFDSQRDDGTPSGASDQLDFLRAIVYVGYKFSDRWLFNSEIEFEHASTDVEGSVSLEFAYLDYLWQPQLNLRFGMVLIPMGFLNELHEPPLFLGARRPDVEQRIIPSTWRENGFGIFGEVGGFSYRSYVVNGLRADGFSSSGIRGGRQKGSEALAEDFAWTGRLDYTGTPGLLLGVSAYVGDSGQGLTDVDGRAIGARTSIYEAHLEWKVRGLELRALGVTAEIDDVARLNRALGLSGGGSIGEEIEGGYFQIGYDVLSQTAGGQKALIPYVRFESYDTQAAVPVGFARNPARDVDSLTLGLAFKPLDELIFKLDYQDYDNDAGTGVDQINLAVGYIF